MPAWLNRNKHLVQAIAWMLLAVPTVLWWKESILWVAIMSLYANIESSLAAHRAGSDQRQEDDRMDVVLVRLERVLGYLEDVSRRLDQLPVRDEFEIGEI